MSRSFFFAFVTVALALGPALFGCDKAERWGSPWAAGSASGASSAVEPGAAKPAASTPAAHH